MFSKEKKMVCLPWYMYPALTNITKVKFRILENCCFHRLIQTKGKELKLY